MSDVDFKIENYRFNIRAAALILDSGRLLMVREKETNYRYTVGGRVHVRETTEEAVIREAKEETGLDYEIDRLVAVEEWLPEGFHNHQICFYYLMKPRPETAALDGHKTDLSNETLHLVNISEFDKYILAPPYLKEFGIEHPEDIQGVKHYVNRRAAFDGE
jgi:ADP-ribose pyrophosphatase YjhB (NUDIX family)